ncbi:hypothetical protein [Cupriavidus necator]
MKDALRILAGVAVLGAVPVLTACYPYPYYPAEVVPTTYPGPQPSRYDRAFAAAAGAMRDQGVSISTEDFSSGTVAGTRNNRQVTASVRRQADGTVRVQFDGSDPADPGLLERISRSYDARMGR